MQCYILYHTVCEAENDIFGGRLRHFLFAFNILEKRRGKDLYEVKNKFCKSF